jgi:hypothetical protein
MVATLDAVAKRVKQRAEIRVARRLSSAEAKLN